MRPDQNLSAEGRKLAFAILILGRLREGRRPPPRALEQAAFVEQWAITPHEDIFVLTGISWRLPLRRSLFVAPLLAIDPSAGWARTVDEWIALGDQQVACEGDDVTPDEVIRRAVVWLPQQMNAAEAERANLRSLLAFERAQRDAQRTANSITD